MIPRWVEKYQQIPFVNKGRNFKGADCLGLIALVLQAEMRITIPDYGFIDAGDGQRIARAIAAAKLADRDWRPFSLRDARAFDVVPMTSANGDGSADHLGIMVSPHHVLHTEIGSGPHVEDIDSYGIKYRLEPRGAPTVYRFRELWTS